MPRSCRLTPPVRPARERSVRLRSSTPLTAAGSLPRRSKLLIALAGSPRVRSAIVELGAREEFVPPAGFALLDERVYGAARLVFLRHDATHGPKLDPPERWSFTMTPPAPVLDHVVIDVRDHIDEAMRCFSALGFQLTPRGHHTLGSVNHLAMFATDYLELLGFGAGGANRTEIARFPAGLNGLVFKTNDADLVHRHAAAAGLPILPVQSFSRPVTLDGATRDARFRTTRLDPDKIAMGRVDFCEHQTPDLVWRPEWQTHPNGARAIARVVVATAEPQRTAVLFRDLFGGDAVAERDGWQVMTAGTAQVDLPR